MKKDTESLKAYQYRRMIEERRGNNFAYPTEEEWGKIETMGYVCDEPTYSIVHAKNRVAELRSNGYYCRIVCRAQGKIRMREYIVIHRPKRSINPAY